jgi:outer membrane usher protein
MSARSTSRSRSSRRGAAAWLVLGLVAMTPVHAASPADSRWLLVDSNPSRRVARDERALEESLVLVEINRVREKDAVLILRNALGDILVGAAALTRWRLSPPAVAPFEHDGERYYPLGAIAAIVVQFDSARQTLAITADPQAFGRTEMRVDRRPAPIVQRASTGAFFNYDVTATKVTSDRVTSSGLFEAGGFTAQGVVTTSAITSDGPLGRDATRLETTYTRDWIEQLRTFRAGDTVSRAGAWGRPVRLGGLQYGTNFATQPGFIRSPTLGAVGQVALPSVVDVFVNNTFVTRREVPPGPFSIAGPGSVNLVVTDLLGRQQVINQPFYASATLLAAGLADYSIEAGVLRQDFAVASNHYGEGVGVGTYRYGLTNNLTGEVHGEAAASARALGVGADWLAFESFVFSGYAASSDSGAGRGGLGVLGFERQGARVRFGARSQWTSEHFRQIGLRSGERPLARLVSMNGGVNFAPYGSLGLAHVRQAGRDGTDVSIYTASYSYQLGRIGFVSLTGSRALGTSAASSVFLVFSTSLGPRGSASVSASSSQSAGSARANDVTATVQQSVPPGEGWGYRALARDSGEVQAGASYQSTYGTYTAEASRFDGREAGRVSVQGGVGTVGGHVFLARPLTESFAVVHLPEFPDVRVLRENHVEARTDRNGYAVLPRLRAFERNRVSVDARDLPLDTRVESLRVEVTPAFRSGVVVPFPVKRERAATVSIVLDDGEVIPPGATVRLNDGGEDFPVAYRGEAFLSGLAPTRNVIRVSWRGEACEIELPQAPANEPIADLGRVACRGVKR